MKIEKWALSFVVCFKSLSSQAFIYIIIIHTCTHTTCTHTRTQASPAARSTVKRRREEESDGEKSDGELVVDEDPSSPAGSSSSYDRAQVRPVWWRVQGFIRNFCNFSGNWIGRDGLERH